MTDNDVICERVHIQFLSQLWRRFDKPGTRKGHHVECSFWMQFFAVRSPSFTPGGNDAKGTVEGIERAAQSAER